METGGAGADPAETSTPRCVTVVIPSYERPRSLARCLEAVTVGAENDPRVDVEVIVVDDGSATSPAAEVDAVEHRVDVRLHRQKNQGPASARNAGARLARHSLVAFTDDDCAPAPGWPHAVTEPLADDPAALVGGTARNAETPLCSSASQYLVDALYRWHSAHPSGAFWTSNNLACSRDEFLDVGGFDETFPLAAGEDRELGVRWARSGRPLRRALDAVVDHHHRLDIRGFWRQHRNYGRGAVHYRDVVADAGDDVEVMPPSFYATLLAEPFRHEPALRALSISGLIGLSQVATVAGFVAERRS